jgi:hypothetical protein
VTFQGLEARVLSRIWLKALLNLSSIWIAGGGFDGGTAGGGGGSDSAGERPMVDLVWDQMERGFGLRIAD